MLIRNAIVCSGRGKATAHLAPLTIQIEDLLGAPPVPGSLNLVLSEPLHLDVGKSLVSFANNRTLWTAKINGIAALVYRYRRCPLHVLEIVSHLHLRSSLGLRDGDVAHIELVGAVKPPLLRRLCWYLLWRGRETKYFSSDRDLMLQRRFRILARLAYQKFPEIKDS